MVKSDVCHTLSLLQVCAGKSKGKQQMRGGRTAPPQRPDIPTPDVDEANAEFVLFARNTMVSTGHASCEFGASFVCCSPVGCTWACLSMPAAEPKRMLSLAVAAMFVHHQHQWEHAAALSHCKHAAVCYRVRPST